MTHSPPVSMRGVALTTAGIYAVIAGIWIAASDRILALIVSNPAEFARFSTVKGWLFVAVTAGLLFWVLRRQLARWEHEAAERQRAAEALRQSEERFRTFVDQADDAFILHDAAGRIIDVNLYATAKLGYTRDELLAMRVWDLSPGLRPDEALARWRGAEAGATGTDSAGYRRKDGTVVEVELRTACFESRGQRMFLAIARDVTERRRIEAMVDGDRRVLEMVAMGADHRETLDELARTIEAQVPGALCSILLLDADGKHLRNGASPNLPAEYVAALGAVEVGPAAGSCGTAVFRRARVVVGDIASDPLWIAGRATALAHGLAACWSTPFFGPDRDVLGTFAIYYRTARKPDPHEIQLVERASHTAAICVTRFRAEQALRANEARLREAQDRLQSALEIGGIGTFVVDFERNETFWDESLSRLYGYTWRPEDGTAIEPFLRIVHPDDRERVRFDINRAATGSEPAHSEYRIVHPHEEIRWVATTARAERSASGRLRRLIGATVDVTARRRAEENFRQSQRVEAIGQLSGGIAHDFNNILTVIQASISFLELEKGLSGTVRDFVAEIKSAATRAGNLTRQLLTFSRKQAMQLRCIELNDIVTNMSRMLQRVLGEHIRMELRLAPQDLGILGDPGMVEQVIMNLAVNARDAMPDGGHLLIATRVVAFEAPAQAGGATREGRFACLEVADTGVGISGETLPHIFEPFFTTKEVGRGTGLGLATVSGIVDQHGGWVDVRTEVGRGTRFLVHIPLISTRALPNAATAAHSGRAVGAETILLVEDESVVRALVRTLLVRSGYRVLDAPSGPRAIELWNENGREIDLLITDTIMPEGMTGFQLAERLRSERPELRVVFTSGYSPEFVSRMGELGEGMTFLAKPFDLENLTSAVRALLDGDPTASPREPGCVSGR